MAIENLTDRAFLNNEHVMGFTISDVDLTSRHVKFAMAVVDDAGEFDVTDPLVEKTNQSVGEMTDVDLLTGQIDVNILAADTASLEAGTYHFQLEVFDTSGTTPVVVASGEIELVLNITETV